jgi:molybdate transport system ATP-binding protein
MQLDVAFETERGSLVTLYGPSGAGKTTILRIVAGLTTAESGLIQFDEEVWFDPRQKINLPPQKRRIGFVFQDYALFPNMTVRENLEYALEKGEKSPVIEELIHVMDLEQLQKRKPDTLSGGQKQRVALARALVRKPKLLLLDEPLSALDTEMRLKLQDHILKVHKQFNLTTILVSHDLAEIYKMSDKILILENGKVIQHGSRADMVLNTGPNDVQLIGEVIKVETTHMSTTVFVAIAGNIVNAILPQTQQESFRTGDKVLVSLQTLQPVIRKIG